MGPKTKFLSIPLFLTIFMAQAIEIKTKDENIERVALILMQEMEYLEKSTIASGDPTLLPVEEKSAVKMQVENLNQAPQLKRRMRQ